MINEIENTIGKIIGECKGIRHIKCGLTVIGYIIIGMFVLGVISEVISWILPVGNVGGEILEKIGMIFSIVGIFGMVVCAKYEKEPKLDENDLDNINSILIKNGINNIEKRELLKQVLIDSECDEEISFWGLGFISGLLLSVVSDLGIMIIVGYIITIIGTINILIVIHKDIKQADIRVAIKAINLINLLKALDDTSKVVTSQRGIISIKSRKI